MKNAPSKSARITVLANIIRFTLLSNNFNNSARFGTANPSLAKA
jgi:hypothetical protein